ncbi:MAG: GDSL-type esterase/lipase family protein [Polyangiaceae bacterium]
MKAEPPVIVQGPELRRPWRVLTSSPVLAVLVVLGLGALSHRVPTLQRIALFDPLPEAETETPSIPAPVLVEGESTLESETTERPELAQPEHVEIPKGSRGPIAAEQGPALEPINVEKPPVPIEDASGKALDGFYSALGRAQRKQPGGIVRVLHFGDSIVTSDYVSGTLRRKLQKRFGDSGHGFMLMANAWPAYFHNDVSRFASSGWKVSRIVGPLSPDGLYGLGGVSFRAPPGSRARFGTAKSGHFGRNVSRFEVSYMLEPGGGKMQLNVDGKQYKVLDTSSGEKRTAVEVIEVPDGPHELEVVTIKGSSRAFGVVMERDEPGVVLDAIGVQGARIRFLDKQDDAHWAEQLQWRKPNLLIFEFGANESGDGFAFPMDQYHETMKAVLQQARKAVPDAGCLILAAMDRAEKKGASLQSMAVIPALVKEQRSTAREVGCAFFNTYEAMGGPGSMAAWVGRGLGQADLTHPTGSGSEVLASWIFRALMSGYDAFNRAQR